MALQTKNLLCSAGKFEHYYLCHYRPKSSGSDELSKSILEFKNGHKVHVSVWVDCAVSELSKTLIKEGAVIIRALGHREKTAAGKTSLDSLGKKLAETFHVQYLPSLLTKPSTPKLTMLKRHERAEALSNRYSFSGNGFKEILIIDDILTTGATMCSIANAIRTISNSCPIKIFTLAATDNNSSLNDSLKRGGFLDPGKLKEDLATVHEGIAPYSEAATLRSKILNDSFN